MESAVVLMVILKYDVPSYGYHSRNSQAIYFTIWLKEMSLCICMDNLLETMKWYHGIDMPSTFAIWLLNSSVKYLQKYFDKELWKVIRFNLDDGTKVSDLKRISKNEWRLFIDILFLDEYEKVRHHLSLRRTKGGYIILKCDPITNRAHRYNKLEPIYDYILNSYKNLRVELNEKMVWLYVTYESCDD